MTISYIWGRGALSLGGGADGGGDAGRGLPLRGEGSCVVSHHAVRSRAWLRCSEE